jgi:hypothetical protein
MKLALQIKEGRYQHMSIEIHHHQVIPLVDKSLNSITSIDSNSIKFNISSILVVKNLKDTSKWEENLRIKKKMNSMRVS